jgi:hypothetical protein
MKGSTRMKTKKKVDSDLAAANKMTIDDLLKETDVVLDQTSEVGALTPAVVSNVSELDLVPATLKSMGTVLKDLTQTQHVTLGGAFEDLYARAGEALASELETQEALVDGIVKVTKRKTELLRNNLEHQLENLRALHTQHKRED